jgi:hypothetical protein
MMISREYHRNGANIEVAEERRLFQALGESRYREYLQAYATYQHWGAAAYYGFKARRYTTSKERRLNIETPSLVKPVFPGLKPAIANSRRTHPQYFLGRATNFIHYRPQ